MHHADIALTPATAQTATRRPPSALALLGAFVLLLAGCSETSTTSSSDAGSAVDAGPSDASPADGGDAGVAPDSGPGPQGRASEITQFGITWVFDQEYDVGQFAHGDHYVVGPVIIASITPASQDGRNGSQINPHLAPPGDPDGLTQPFDDRAGYYSASTLFTGGTLEPGDSLVSTISRDEALTETDWTGGGVNDAVKLRTSAVLTVLDAHPAVLSFRPSYIKDRKTLYTVNQLDTSILDALDLDGVALPDHGGFATIEYFLRGFERPWTFIHGYDWTARSIVPLDNAHDYHEPVGLFWSEASLVLLSNWEGLDVEDKAQLLYRLVQTGIDHYAAVSSSGVRTSYEWAWPLVFTGLLLNEPDIYDFWVDHPSKRTQRGHEKLYYLGNRDESTASAIVPEGETWVGWTAASGMSPAFAKQAGEEYEHLHPSEWTCYEPHCKAEVYRAQHDVYPLIGMTLASILIDRNSPHDVNALLAHDPIRDYCDRWMDEGFMTNPYQNTGRTFLEEMEHHTSFTIYNYRYGSGGSQFINDMWAAHR